MLHKSRCTYLCGLLQLIPLGPHPWRVLPDLNVEIQGRLSQRQEEIALKTKTFAETQGHTAVRSGVNRVEECECIKIKPQR